MLLAILNHLKEYTIILHIHTHTLRATAQDVAGTIGTHDSGNNIVTADAENPTWRIKTSGWLRRGSLGLLGVLMAKSTEVDFGFPSSGASGILVLLLRHVGELGPFLA